MTREQEVNRLKRAIERAASRDGGFWFLADLLYEAIIEGDITQDDIPEMYDVFMAKRTAIISRTQSVNARKSKIAELRRVIKISVDEYIAASKLHD